MEALKNLQPDGYDKGVDSVVKKLPTNPIVMGLLVVFGTQLIILLLFVVGFCSIFLAPFFLIGYIYYYYCKYKLFLHKQKSK